ncbi:MAG TPA: hypothetical protein VFJ85_03435 [Acidimicrobiales bacterium]|nr:hypothetical protein [Acidimicrobiales bacterium]
MADDIVPDAVPDEPLPPFERLYPPGALISPRMAYWLWATAQVLGDTWREEWKAGEEMTWWFPVVARPYATSVWLERFIACFDAVAERLAAGFDQDYGLPTCTGEELALHFVLDAAFDFVNDGLLVADEQVAALRPGSDDEADFDAARADLFVDHDVLLLFDPAFDGVEDPAGFLAKRYWLGILGPSTTWLLRRLVDGLDAHPGGYDLDLTETARCLGLGTRAGATRRSCGPSVAAPSSTWPRPTVPASWRLLAA